MLYAGLYGFVRVWGKVPIPLSMATLRENVFLSVGLPLGNWAIDYYTND